MRATRLLLYLILLRVGFTPATSVTSCAVRSYRTFSPLPVYSTGGLFSAALSVGSRLPGVTWHPAQWSPDFPPFYRDDKTATAQPTLSGCSVSCWLTYCLKTFFVKHRLAIKPAYVSTMRFLS